MNFSALLAISSCRSHDMSHDIMNKASEKVEI